MEKRRDEQLVRRPTVAETALVESSRGRSETGLEGVLNTKMNRRSFVIGSLLAGMAGVTAFKTKPALAAEGTEQEKRMLVTIFMEGGADPTFSPYLYRDSTTAEHTIGPFQAPPIGAAGAPDGLFYVDDPDGNPVHWLEAGGSNSQVMVHDRETNSHTTGQERRRGDDDMMMPAAADMYAHHHGQGNSLAHLTTVNMSYAGPLTPATPIDNLRDLLRRAVPNKTQNGGEHLPQEVYEMIQASRIEELQEILDGTALPRLKKIAASRLAAQDAGKKLATQLAVIDGANQEQDPLVRAFIMGMGMHQNGDLWSLSLETGGFDTHNNPLQQWVRQNAVYRAINRMRNIAKTNGVKVDFIIDTDFGRGPTGGDTSSHNPTSHGVIISDQITTPRLAGNLDKDRNLLGNRSNYADVVAEQRRFLKIDQINFGINTSLSKITEPDAIKNELNL